MNIITPIQKLAQAARAERASRLAPKDEPVIAVTTRTSRASFIYERMRAAVDYKEEHLVRRTAIERIIKRMLTAGEREYMAENLVTELIHARYLPNDTIAQSRLPELEKILQKYFLLLGLLPPSDVNSSRSLSGWVVSITASEIDEFLMPPYVMHAAINAMYEVMNRELHIEDPINDADRGKQIYLAASRTLYHNDDNLRFHTFLLYYPQWKQASDDLIKEVGAGLSNLRTQIEFDLNHPLKEKLNTTMRKHVVYFTILTEIIAANPEEAWAALQDDEALRKKIEVACDNHYRAARVKLRRSIGRSVIYLVLTKFLLAFILEIPVEFFLLRRYDLTPLLINLVFPPGLLTVIALSTRVPDQANTRLIAEGIAKIVRGEGEIIQVAKTKPRNFFMRTLFILLYGLLFIVSFGLLIYGLGRLNFSVVGMLVFLFFLSLVSLFAYRIRRNTQELIITPPKRGVIRSLWGFFTIPVLHAGKWMSGKFAQINIFIFILDFVIEAPFKSFIKITEEWMNYVHEKKEEI